MSEFRLVSGNRLEWLAADLAARLEDGREDPFVPELVVVQSRGMERWLNMAVADCSGISANLCFPFPRNFIQDYFFAPLLAAYGIDQSGQQYFTPAAMTWRIAAQLPRLLADRDFEPLRRYLEPGPNRSLKMIQLASRLAGCFDQYLLFRPDVINEWEAGRNPLAHCPDSRWQMRLWLALTDGLPPVHFAALWQRARLWLSGEAELFDGRAPDFHELEQLRRIFFFGFSSLAPALMDLFIAASRLLEVNFYYLNPSAQFWEHNFPYSKVIREAGKKMRLLVDKAGLRSLPDLEPLQAALHFETGHALLGSWGEQGREFFCLVTAMDEIEDDRQFVAWAEDSEMTLLRRMQNDILELRMPDAPEAGWTADDDSVQIHSCHGLMREVEILYDNLIAVFRRHPDIRPGDVLVLAPDIELYASYIEAVFRTLPADDPGWVYATIADRSSMASLPEVKVFRQLLLLDREQYRVSAVLAILDCEAVRARFSLSDRDMELVRRWLCDTGVNWGIDADYRQRQTEVAFGENSWRQGLDRMLTGLAMSSADRSDPVWRSPVAGEVLPYGNIENEAESILGRLCDFSGKVFELGERIRELESRGAAPQEWGDLLLDTVDQFLAEGPEYYPAINALRLASGAMLGDMAMGGIVAGTTPAFLRLDLDTVLEALTEKLGERSSGGFLMGGITFCEARPMRSVPAKVVCLLGMNEGSFPRQEKRLSFDLMPRQPRFGDRSARNDDRYLFLEALLSARSIFYVSYIGQSDRDNSRLPPGVLVSELQEYIIKHYRHADGSGLSIEELTRFHPLQSFSARYFQPGSEHLRSCSADNYAVAAALATRRVAAVRGGIAIAELPEPVADEDGDGIITLDMLAEFFAGPARYFCRRRLGIDLEIRDARLPEDREKFTFNSLDGFTWARELLLEHPEQFRGEPDPQFMAALRRRLLIQGVLPPGAAGTVEFDLFMRDFIPYAARVSSLASEKLPPVKIMTELPDINTPLYVELNQLFRHGEGGLQLFCRYARSRPRELLRAGIFNLALGLGEVRERLEGDQWLTGYEFKDDARQQWERPDDARNAALKLAGLVKLYREGMRRPLEFLPDAGFELVKAVRGGRYPENVVRQRVAAVWKERVGDEERVEPHVAFCFGPEMPDDSDFWQRFRDCSLRVDELLMPNDGEVGS